MLDTKITNIENTFKSLILSFNQIKLKSYEAKESFVNIRNIFTSSLKESVEDIEQLITKINSSKIEDENVDHESPAAVKKFDLFFSNGTKIFVYENSGARTFTINTVLPPSF